MQKPQNKYLAVVTQHKTINLQSTPITATPGAAGENIQACSQQLLLHDCSSHRGKRRGSRTAPIRTLTRHAFLAANAPGPLFILNISWCHVGSGHRCQNPQIKLQVRRNNPVVQHFSDTEMPGWDMTQKKHAPLSQDEFCDG